MNRIKKWLWKSIVDTFWDTIFTICACLFILAIIGIGDLIYIFAFHGTHPILMGKESLIGWSIKLPAVLLLWNLISDGHKIKKSEAK
ncbi:hypothetical protein WR164_01440 [Philodulcilactobacillus myokoensis]|uniref:Uncharacterized protein n=1 Tax=Philodulcilactobacillus myokoensis TaxID=2929573 RepID=A0A9W6AZ01_9LACO|nr:hypothetical protein [Philodulcilactobacillus myokoensis]GLB46165.1 hypothetical protein WR164_01440 [Philodulcilactobacillus myokoensis]